MRVEQLEDLDDLPDSEIEELEEEVIEQASAAATVPELEAEIKTLERLGPSHARCVRPEPTASGNNFRSFCPNGTRCSTDSGARRKLIVFTRARRYSQLPRRSIRNLLGRDEAVVTIHHRRGQEAIERLHY